MACNLSTNAAMLIQNYADLTLDDFNLDAEENPNVIYALSSNNGNVNIIGSSSIYTYDDGSGLPNDAFDSCEAAAHGYSQGSHVTVDTTGDIEGIMEYDPWGTSDKHVSSITIKNGTFYAPLKVDSTLKSAAKSNIKIEGGVFYNDSLPLEYVTDGTPIANVDAKVNGPYDVVGDAAIQKAAEDSGNTITITKGSISLTGANATIANAKDNKGTVTVDGATVEPGNSVKPNAATTIANLKNQIASLQAQLDQAQKTTNTSSSQIAQLKKDLADAQAQLKSAQDQLKAAQDQSASQSSTLTAPGQVMNLKVKAGKRKAKLTWTALTDNTTGYRVYRKVKGGKYAKVKTIKTASTATWTNKGLKKGKTYYYKVRAYKSITSGELWGAYSNTAKGKIK